jgi:hypothetical protein
MNPSLREELIVAYLEGDSPDLEEVQELATMSDAKVAELYAVWDSVKPHDGCISYEDSVRLALYVYEGGLRAVRTTNKAHQCIVCQEGFDTNGLAFEINCHVLDYCADCAQLVADVMKHHFPDDDDENSCWEAQTEEEQRNGIWVDTTDGPFLVEPKPKLNEDAIVAAENRISNYKGRPKGIVEEEPREVCVSSCCGTVGARTRDGSCKGCRK